MIDKDRAVGHLLDLLAIEGPSGGEAKVAAAIAKKLVEAGCKKAWVESDDAHLRLGPGYGTGNLVVKMPGTLRGAPRILFSAHMDTVPLCKGAVPAVRGGRVVARGKTGLGGDDRSGCAAIVSMAEALLRRKTPHPPMTLLFPVAEENGLNGSRMVRFSDLGHPSMGFNLDGQAPDEIVVGAMGAVRWRAEIEGLSSHAGLHPHKGVSAGLIGSKAMAEIAARGYFGRIVRGNRCGTSNLGRIEGGQASNQVMHEAVFSGECRSHSPAFLEQIAGVYRACFERAARSVANDEGQCGRVVFSSIGDYRAFRLKKTEPCVRMAGRAVAAAGLAPRPVVMDAGLDANNLNEKGLPTVTLGTGSHNFHTVGEYVEIGEYLDACRVLLHIVRLAC